MTYRLDVEHLAATRSGLAAKAARRRDRRATRRGSTSAAPCQPLSAAPAWLCGSRLEHPQRAGEQDGGEHHGEAGFDALEGPEPAGRLIGDGPAVSRAP